RPEEPAGTPGPGSAGRVAPAGGLRPVVAAGDSAGDPEWRAHPGTGGAHTGAVTTYPASQAGAAGAGIQGSVAADPPAAGAAISGGPAAYTGRNRPAAGVFRAER